TKVKRQFRSERVSSIVRRRLILCVLVIATVSLAYDVGRLAGIMSTPSVFQKDFMAYYLPGRALFSGGKIYDPLPILADRYESRAAHHFEHPTPYPPIAIIFLSPLSLLRYEYAVSIWSLFELAALSSLACFCFAILAVEKLQHQ